jgi:hypothetical protein
MSHSVVNSFWKKLRTSCKTGYGISNAVIHLCMKLEVNLLYLFGKIFDFDWTNFVVERAICFKGLFVKRSLSMSVQHYPT